MIVHLTFLTDETIIAKKMQRECLDLSCIHLHVEIIVNSHWILWYNRDVKITKEVRVNCLLHYKSLK